MPKVVWKTEQRLPQPLIPAVHFEMVDEGFAVRVDWPEGTDPNDMATMLIAVQKGLLREYVNHALAKSTMEAGQPETGHAIGRYLDDHLKKSAKPAISPLHAYKTLVRTS